MSKNRDLTTPLIIGGSILGVGLFSLWYMAETGIIPGLPEPVQKPIASFVVTPKLPVRARTKLTFDAGGSTHPDPTKQIVKYNWAMGDGTTKTGIRITHTYNKKGVYPVTLTVTDNAGITGTITLTVEIKAPIVGEVVKPLFPGRRPPIHALTLSGMNRFLTLLEPKVLKLPGIKRNYHLNMGGEVAVWSGSKVGRFIKGGGVWIDYTEYPFFHLDVAPPLWFPLDTRFNDLSRALDIQEFYTNIPWFGRHAHFFADRFAGFPLKRSLVIPRVPPELIGNLDTPHVRNNVYSCFALKKNGFYFYANRAISPEKFTAFIVKTLQAR